MGTAKVLHPIPTQNLDPWGPGSARSLHGDQSLASAVLECCPPRNAVLLEARVLLSGLAQDGNVRVCIFPESEEILVRGTSLSGIALQ